MKDRLELALHVQCLVAETVQSLVTIQCLLFCDWLRRYDNVSLHDCDKRTDRQIVCHNTVSDMHARRAAKTAPLKKIFFKLLISQSINQSFNSGNYTQTIKQYT